MAERRASRSPSSKRCPIRFAPGEESRIVDQAIFDDFGIAGPQLASVERVEQRGIGDDEQRMVEGPDQILLPGRVDGGLAADGAVGLGEQGRRYVDDRAAALEQGRGEAGDVADRATAQRNDRGAALDVQARRAGR